MGKRVITGADVVAAAESGNKIIDAPLGECIITHEARDKALYLGLKLDETSAQGNSSSAGKKTVESTQAEEVVSQVTSLIKDRVSSKLSSEQLKNLVRKVVADHLAKSPPPNKHHPDQAVFHGDGVCFIKGNMIQGELTGPIPVEEKVMVADAFRCSNDSSLAGGYMEWSKASFHRIVDKDEISVVIDGELHLTVGGRTSVVKQGDMVYLHQGTEVIYSAPGRVKLACVNSLKK